ncbi:MAG: 30S ribosomal protein S17 [Candidatus Bathyarchaeota archaeon]
MVKLIGLQVKKPQKECDDPHCPFHSKLSVRKKLLQGTVVNAKMQGTIIVQMDYAHYIPKYLRYERRRSRIPAHNPACISAKEGDTVKISECRPLCKTVSFVVVEKTSEGETNARS